MDESYRQMMESYAEQQKSLSKKPPWIGVKTKGSMEPSDMTVTHVNQTRNLVVSLHISRQHNLPGSLVRFSKLHHRVCHANGLRFLCVRMRASGRQNQLRSRRLTIG